jgi:hypothetical protein
MIRHKLKMGTQDDGVELAGDHLADEGLIGDRACAR